VIIHLPQSEIEIPSGISAEITFKPGGQSGVLVPKDALVATQHGAFVYRLEQDSTVAPLEVKTGSGSGSWVQVFGDIQIGDSIVTVENERLRPGQKVAATGNMHIHETH
jgi:hypothetical protein